MFHKHFPAPVTTFEGLDWWELTELQSLAVELTEVDLSTYISCDNHLYATKRCSAFSSTLHHLVQTAKGVAIHHADLIDDKDISLLEMIRSGLFVLVLLEKSFLKLID